MESKKLIKKILIGLAVFIGIIIIITAVVEVINEELAKESNPEQKTEIKREVYPASIIKTIQDLEKSKDTKQTRYKLFDQQVAKTIPYKPSDSDLEFYKKFVLSDYKKMTLEYVQTLTDEELLKIIYRNRPVDVYFADREIYDSPLGGVAFNVIQIAREQYEGTLTEKNFKIFKYTMDKHFNNME